MIIESLLNMIISLLTTLLNFVNIPQIPSDVLSSVNDTIDLFISRAAEMIDLVLPYNIVVVLVGIVLVIEVAIHVYHFVLWVLKKIPMLGIE